MKGVVDRGRPPRLIGSVPRDSNQCCNACSTPLSRGVSGSVTVKGGPRQSGKSMQRTVRGTSLCRLGTSLQRAVASGAGSLVWLSSRSGMSWTNSGAHSEWARWSFDHWRRAVDPWMGVKRKPRIGCLRRTNSKPNTKIATEDQVLPWGNVAAMQRSKALALWISVTAWLRKVAAQQGGRGRSCTVFVQLFLPNRSPGAKSLSPLSGRLIVTWMKALLLSTAMMGSNVALLRKSPRNASICGFALNGLTPKEWRRATLFASLSNTRKHLGLLMGSSNKSLSFWWSCWMMPTLGDGPGDELPWGRSSFLPVLEPALPPTSQSTTWCKELPLHPRQVWQRCPSNHMAPDPLSLVWCQTTGATQCLWVLLVVPAEWMVPWLVWGVPILSRQTSITNQRFPAWQVGYEGGQDGQQGPAAP